MPPILKIYALWNTAGVGRAWQSMAEHGRKKSENDTVKNNIFVGKLTVWNACVQGPRGQRVKVPGISRLWRTAGSLSLRVSWLPVLSVMSFYQDPEECATMLVASADPRWPKWTCWIDLNSLQSPESHDLETTWSSVGQCTLEVGLLAHLRDLWFRLPLCIRHGGGVTWLRR